MLGTRAVLYFTLAIASTWATADARNPFSPASADVFLRNSAPARILAPVPSFPPPLLPPPPARDATPPPDVPSFAVAAPGGVGASKRKGRTTRTIPACQIIPATGSVSSLASGGVVAIRLKEGSRDCVSAVLVAEDWLEAKELSDPRFVKIVVEVNKSSLPRQSRITLANTRQSTSITLVQEGQAPTR